MLKIAATALLAVLVATPANAQDRFFPGLNRGMEELENTLRLQRSLNSDHLVYAVTLRNGVAVFIDTSTLQRNRNIVRFEQVHTVNNNSHIRYQILGDCASGNLTDLGSQAFFGSNQAISRNGSGTSYYAPGSFGRQILNRACELSAGDD